MIIVTFFIVIPVSAVDIGQTPGGLLDNATDSFPSDTDETTFVATIGLVIRMALSLLGVIFLSLMLYAGFLWMTARGNDQQVEKAIKTIRQAVIGLIIVTSAYSITAFVVPMIVASTAG